MTARSHLERLHQADRAATRKGLMDQGMSEQLAEDWCWAWEREARQRGIEHSEAFWQEGLAWIDSRRVHFD